jgi:hypothetical protein
MAEIETTPGPTEKLPVIDHHHKTDSVHGSNEEKAPTSHDHDHEHKDNQPPSETEELSEGYDPNVYAGTSCLIPRPTDTDT